MLGPAKTTLFLADPGGKASKQLFAHRIGRGLDTSAAEGYSLSCCRKSSPIFWKRYCSHLSPPSD
jgi:hypothetical protein